MPSYQSTVKQLFDLQKFAIKLDLDNIGALCRFLDNPHRNYPVIHVAGTNGKGSTAFFTARILQAMGLHVGLFTSPHLIDFRERITINGRKISQSFVINFWEQIRNIVLKRKATFFDTTTAMAFEYFSQKKIDIAVIETGLGGRLDSTNIVKPVYAVITPIHYDHQKQLGDNLTEIAAEKAGIIKPGIKIFSASQEAETLASLHSRIDETNFFNYLPDLVNHQINRSSLDGVDFNLEDFKRNINYSGLICAQVGDFQVANIALAYSAAREYCDDSGIFFLKKSFKKTLASAVWPGRLQRVERNPDIIFDVSHNFEGIRKSLSFISRFVDKSKLKIVLGLVDDKNHLQIANEIARHSENIIITEPRTHRKLSGEKIQKILKQSVKKTILIKELNRAFDFCRKGLKPNETCLVTGSHYLAGPLLARYKLI